MRRRPSLDALLDRGVYQAPWFGPAGELVLVAISRDHRIVGEPIIVPDGASRVGASDELLARLALADPMPELRII